MFKCECGKEFENAQSFNGHKSHCKVHQLAKYGNLDRLEAATKLRSAVGGKTNSKKHQLVRLEELSKWIIEQHTCECCGKIMTEKFGSGRFCSRACANRHKHSEETKQKISASTKQSMLIAWEQHPETWTTNRHTNNYTCRICGATIRYCNITGLCRHCLETTEAGRQQKIVSGKKGYVTMQKHGSHKPWQSRNITSYAEKFWEQVLENNNIAFQREVAIKKDAVNCYFLDFVINVNNHLIDLEIDGKQHNYKDRQESDKIRDTYLKSLNYIIYRIPWNEIKSEAGKAEMQQKINKFLEFYKTL